MFEHLLIWMNGKMVPWNEASVHVLSHGFSRASAIFDVFGVHPGPNGPVAFRMDKHIERLFRTAELLEMEIAYSKGQMIEAVVHSVNANSVSRGLVKIMAYYGEQAVTSLVLGSKLDVAVCAVPAFEELGLDRSAAIDICFSKWRKIHPATVPVEAKACSNYLNAMLARKDAKSRGFDVGILLTTDGYVAEGSTESVFMVKDGVLKTPKLGNVLRSITRLSILEAASALGIKTSEEQMIPEDLMVADEIFIAHTSVKIHPVKKIEDRTFDQVPGPVTQRLHRLIDDICHSRSEHFKDWLQPVDGKRQSILT